MTIHEALFSTVRQPLLTVLYLLLTLQMALFLASIRDKRSGRLRLFLLLHLLFSFVCLWLPFMDIDSNYFQTDAPIPLPAARSAFTLLPVWTLLLYEVLTALIQAAVFWIVSAIGGTTRPLQASRRRWTCSRRESPSAGRTGRWNSAISRWTACSVL